MVTDSELVRRMVTEAVEIGFISHTTVEKELAQTNELFPMLRSHPRHDLYYVCNEEHRFNATNYGSLSDAEYDKVLSILFPEA